jgi:pantetheine-phosphate adenylyltransferase
MKAVFPGSFDPIHYGHINIAYRAAKIFSTVIVAVYDKPLKQLLFSLDERLDLAREVFKNHDKIQVMAYSGLTVDFCKQVGSGVLVRGLRVFSDFENEFRIALANQRLDPSIEMISFITQEQHTFLSASTVKEIAVLGGDISTMVPPIVNEALQEKFKNQGE